jgi:hypothetical protein
MIAAAIIGVISAMMSLNTMRTVQKLLQEDSAAYITRMEQAYSHSSFAYIVTNFLGVIFLILCVEGLAYVIRGDWRKKKI